jgi:hypothetical protein
MQLRNKMVLLEETGLYGFPFHICRSDGTTHSKTGRLVTLLYLKVPYSLEQQDSIMQSTEK